MHVERDPGFYVELGQTAARRRYCKFVPPANRIQGICPLLIERNS